MPNQPTDKVIYTVNQNILIHTKKSNAYSQALRFNKISYNKIDLHNNCNRLLNTLTKSGYNKTDAATQINRAMSISRNELLCKVKTFSTENLPLTVTYNRTLPDLRIKPKLKEIFAETPILSFRRNKNLRDIIEGNKIFDRKKKLGVNKFNKGKCQSCFTTSINLCCKQLKTCSILQSAFNKNTFLIRHSITCKRSSLIYLIECCLCEKLHVGKSEYSLNLKKDTHRNDIWRTDSPPCDKHFQMPAHNFNAHAKFTINEEVYHYQS